MHATARSIEKSQLKIQFPSAIQPAPILAISPPDARTRDATRGLSVRFAVLALVVAAFAAYFNSLNAPFVFDDNPGVRENLTCSPRIVRD